MTIKHVGLAAIIVCFSVCAYAITPQRTAEEQVLISVKVCKQDGADSEVRILAHPKVAAIVGKSFQFKAGGKLEARPGEDELNFGTSLSVKVQSTSTDAVQLALKIDVGSLVSIRDDADSAMVITETLEIRTSVKLGEVKRLHCTNLHWCEITVTSVE